MMGLFNMLAQNITEFAECFSRAWEWPDTKRSEKMKVPKTKGGLGVLPEIFLAKEAVNYAI